MSDEGVWMTRDAVERMRSERRDDERRDDGGMDTLTAAVMQREGLLGECLLRSRLALTAMFLENYDEAEAVLAALTALLVEHDIIDPSAPVRGGETSG